MDVNTAEAKDTNFDSTELILMINRLSLRRVPKNSICAGADFCQAVRNAFCGIGKFLFSIVWLRKIKINASAERFHAIAKLLNAPSCVDRDVLKQIPQGQEIDISELSLHDAQLIGQHRRARQLRCQLGAELEMAIVSEVSRSLMMRVLAGHSRSARQSIE